MTEHELLEDYLKGVFWQKQYPIYSLASYFGCCESTVVKLAAQHSIKTFKFNSTRFISRDEIIKMLTLPSEDCQKHLLRIRQKT
jgi:hypothetical protein